MNRSWNQFLSILMSGFPLALLGSTGNPVSPEALAVNPSLLPESEYPYWPEYQHLETEDLAGIKAQEWIGHEHTIEGWDWSLPGFVEPAPNSLVGLQRIIGLEKEYQSINLQFKANAIGILWVKWRDIEQRPGEYDFSRVINRIKQANELGIDVILRILTCSKLRGSGSHALDSGDAPLWLEELGVPLLPRKRDRDNLNFDPAHPVFHQRYLRLVKEMDNSGIPEMVKAAYVGYESHSFGDEGIGPYGESEAAENDALPHVRERLDAWHNAFRGMEHKVFMGGSSHYGFEKGFGVRRGFVEMFLYNIPNEDIGQHIDLNGYLYVDEDAPVIKYQCFNGEVNEEYEEAWTSAGRGHRFGVTTNSFPYRYFTSTLRALQMRCTYIHTTGHLIPEMLPFLSLELARTVDDAPDVWCFLRESTLRASTYRNKDSRNREISEEEQKSGIPIKNFARWLYQRDAKGYETRPAVRINHPIKMWMVENDKNYDHIARTGKRIGFDIDDRWDEQKGAVAIKVTYFDNVKGSLEFISKSGNGTVQKLLSLRGDGKLRTTTFLLDDMKANGLDHGYDFVLQAGNGTREITVSMVRVIELE